MTNIRDHKFIVWGFENFNPLGIVRSLGKEGIKPFVIIIKDGSESITSASKYIEERYFAASVDEGFDLLLRLFGNEEAPPFVITSDDTITSYIDQRYNVLTGKFIFFNAGTSGRISHFMDKSNIIQLAVSHGLKVLPTHVVNVGEIPDDIEYPVITKAVSSVTLGWKSEVHICRNREDLTEAYRQIKSKKVILQKYISKKNELCLDGFSVAKGKETEIAIASSYNSINEDSYSNNMTVFKLNNQFVADAVKSMLSEIGFEGIWSVEFLVDESDALYFLEVNFRNSTWSYAATKAGMNLVTGWAEGMLTGRISSGFEKSIPDNYKAIAEIQDFRDRVKTHKITLLQWIKELKEYDCKFLYDKEDNKPFWNEIRGIIKRKVTRFKR